MIPVNSTSTTEELMATSNPAKLLKKFDSVLLGSKASTCLIMCKKGEIASANGSPLKEMDGALIVGEKVIEIHRGVSSEDFSISLEEEGFSVQLPRNVSEPVIVFLTFSIGQRAAILYQDTNKHGNKQLFFSRKFKNSSQVSLVSDIIRSQYKEGAEA